LALALNHARRDDLVRRDDMPISGCDGA